MKIDIKPNFNFRFKNVFKGKKNIYLVLGFLLLFLILLFNSTHLIATLQWFGEVGYTRTYLTRAFSVAGLTIPIFLVFYFVSIFYNKSIAKKYDQVSYPQKTPEQIKIRNRFVYIAVAVFFGIVSLWTGQGQLVSDSSVHQRCRF